MSGPRPVGALIVFGAVAAGASLLGWQYSRARTTREVLFAELTPVQLANCEVDRYGDANDGGYLLCRNLMGQAQAAYSYGIDGHDEWGCEVARELSIPLHQYDCFNTTAPSCPGISAFFNAACVGPGSDIIDGRRFGTIGEHVAKNGDTGKPLLMKVDVEGSEWASFLATPDAVFRDVEQLAVEFHGIDDPRSVDVVRRLKQFFYVANIHINNYSCSPGYEPFPGEVFEVLFVAKRLAEVAPAPRESRHHPLDAPNAATLPDCQGEAAPTSGYTSFNLWVRRFVRRTIFGSPFAGF